MKISFLLVLFCLFLIGCANRAIKRLPSTSGYQPQYSCSELLSFLFKKVEMPELELVKRDDIKILSSEQVIHNFEGTKDASLDFVVIKTILNIGEFNIAIIVPHSNQEMDKIFLNEIINNLTLLPSDYIKNLKTISLSPSDHILKKAIASAGQDEITFYKRSEAPMELSSFKIHEYAFKHEFGHIMAYSEAFFGNSIPNEAWIKAMKLDGQSVSSYADTDTSEDFAETVELYLRIEQDGLSDKAWKSFSHRFAFLDEKMHKDPNLRYKLRTIKRLQKTAIVTLVTLISGVTYFLIDDEK